MWEPQQYMDGLYKIKILPLVVWKTQTKLGRVFVGKCAQECMRMYVRAHFCSLVPGFPVNDDGDDLGKESLWSSPITRTIIMFLREIVLYFCKERTLGWDPFILGKVEWTNTSTRLYDSYMYMFLH